MVIYIGLVDLLIISGWSLLDYFLSPCTGDATALEQGKENTSDLRERERERKRGRIIESIIIKDDNYILTSRIPKTTPKAPPTEPMSTRLSSRRSMHP